MKSAGKILIVSPDFPYPPNHGGRLDVWNQIKALKRIGWDIDLIATVKTPPAPEDIDKVKTCVNRLTCCPRKNRLRDMFSRLPLQSRSRKKLRTVACPTGYDIVMLESEYVYSILGNPNLRAGSFVLRIQNDERQYFQELCTASPIGPRKLYFFLEAMRFNHLWNLIRVRVPHMMFISRDEFEAAMRRYPEIRGVFLPAGAANGEFTAPLTKSRKVLFVGSLFMVNNREGLRWYIKHIHPRLSDLTEYEFIVAGNSKGQSLKWLDDLTRDYDNITVFDSPADIKPLYDDGAVFVNPMLHGTGVKMKTIEAVRNGLPVVSTTVGNQGTGLRDGRDILVSDDPERFAEHVQSLLEKPARGVDLVTSAQNFIRENYNQEAILTDFFRELPQKGSRQ